jgi:hypothetical protein
VGGALVYEAACVCLSLACRGAPSRVLEEVVPKSREGYSLDYRSLISSKSIRVGIIDELGSHHNNMHGVARIKAGSISCRTRTAWV